MTARFLRAKIEAVMQCVGVVLLPFAGLLGSSRCAKALARGSRRRRRGGILDRHPALVPRAIQAQPFSPAPHVLADRNAVRGLVSITWAAAGAVAAVSTGLAAIAVRASRWRFFFAFAPWPRARRDRSGIGIFRNFSCRTGDRKTGRRRHPMQYAGNIRWERHHEEE